MSEKIKPELLPADLGGGDIQFIKRADYARRTAETVALKLKAEVKRDHVMQILTALDGGQTELPGDNPEPIVKLFEVVREDYQSAVEEIKRKDKETAEKKAADEQKAAAQKEREDNLFLAVKDQAPVLSVFDKFDTGNMDRFVPRGEVSDADLLSALKAGLNMESFSGWMIGDLVCELENRGQLNVVKRLAEDSGKPYSKVYNDAKTARVFPPDKRSQGVAFTVYREVANAKFTDEQKKTALPTLVSEIAEGKHTSQSAREMILDPVTKLRFTNFRAKPENRWESLTEWKQEEKEEKEPQTPAEEPKKKGGKKK
jgi:hypothetical protein